MRQDVQIEKIKYIRELCKDLLILYKEVDNINYLKKITSYTIIDNNFNVIDRSSYERS